MSFASMHNDYLDPDRHDWPVEEAKPMPEEAVPLYRELADGLSDMVEGGRLGEGEIPEDFAWLVGLLANIAAEDPE